jgi:ABC-2 type transport system ATP-binding protein
MAAQEIMIDVKNLTKTYGEVRALDDVTFEVRSGEVLGFLGPNGAGKTTTMKILTCFIAPTKGTASVAGTDILESSLEIRKNVGYLPENAPLYVDMQVREYLDFVTDIRGIPADGKAAAKKRVIDTCGLGNVVHKEIRTLSKGYRQRVGLAQAMIHDPKILILDEPTSGLDPNQIVEIRELIKSLGEERTVILSTHNLSEVQATAKRVIIIHAGKLVADGSLEELEADRGGARYNVQLAKTDAGAEDIEKAFSAIEGVQEVELPGELTGDELDIVIRSKGEPDLRADIFRKVVDQDWVLLGLERKQVDLETVFRKLTSGTDTASADKK